MQGLLLYGNKTVDTYAVVYKVVNRSVLVMSDELGVPATFVARHGLTELQAQIVGVIAVLHGSGEQINSEMVAKQVGCTGQYVRKLLDDPKVQIACTELAGPDLLLNLGPLMRAGVRKALQGSHPHWQDCMKMAGWLKREDTSVAMQFNITGQSAVESRIAEIEAELGGADEPVD